MVSRASANEVQANTVQSILMANKVNANKSAKSTSANRLTQTDEIASNKIVWGMISKAIENILVAFEFANKKRRG